MDFVLSFATALFLSTVLIPMIMRVSEPLGLLDVPNDDRRMHSEAIPRSGGLGIALGVIPVLYWLPVEGPVWGLILGALVIVAFGVADDRNSLSYRWKFAGQIAAVFLAMSGGITIEHLPFVDLDHVSPWLAYPLTFLFILGVTNAVNLSDGLDGLAAGTTLLAFGVMAYFAFLSGNYVALLLALSLCGALLGFLRYNTHPARLFMGDTGSQFLGFMAACLAIEVTQHESSPVSPVLPLLFLGLPIMDTLSVMFVRIKERRNPFHPDKNHIHHQLMKLGMYHHEAVATIYALQAVLIILTYSLCYAMDSTVLVTYLIFCALVLGTMYGLKSIGWKLHGPDDINSLASKERRSLLLTHIRWYYGMSALVVQSMLAVFLLACAFYLSDLPQDIVSASWVAVGLLLLAWSLYKGSREVLARLTTYTASMFVVYGLYVMAPQSGFNIWIDGFLVAVALLLALSIRMTRKEHFRLDNQDILILFIVLVVPQLPFETLSDFSVGQITLRMCVLLYACEFLISKREVDLKLLNCAAIVTLVFLGMS